MTNNRINFSRSFCRLLTTVPTVTWPFFPLSLSFNYFGRIFLGFADANLLDGLNRTRNSRVNALAPEHCSGSMAREVQGSETVLARRRPSPDKDEDKLTTFHIFVELKTLKILDLREASEDGSVTSIS